MNLFFKPIFRLWQNELIADVAWLPGGQLQGDGFFFRSALSVKRECFSHAGSIKQKNGIVKLLNTHEVVPWCPHPVPKQISEPYIISPWLLGLMILSEVDTAGFALARSCPALPWWVTSCRH